MSKTFSVQTTKLAKVLLAAVLVVASVAMTAKSAEAVDIGKNKSVNVYGSVTEFFDHDIDTVVTIDLNKTPTGSKNQPIDFRKTTIAAAEKQQWARTVDIQRRFRLLTGWDVGNPSHRARIIREGTVISRALDNELARGKNGKLNLPQETKGAHALYTIFRAQGVHTDCRGRCLKYTYRSVSLTTLFTVLGAAAGAGLLGATTPVIFGVSAVAGLMVLLISTFVMLKERAGAARSAVIASQAVQAQNYLNNFMYQGLQQAENRADQMQVQLNDMAAQMNRIEAGIANNNDVNMLP